MSAHENGTWVHRLWWHTSDKATWALPLWRPFCWRKGRHQDWEGRCIVCAKPTTLNDGQVRP